MLEIKELLTHECLRYNLKQIIKHIAV